MIRRVAGSGRPSQWRLFRGRDNLAALNGVHRRPCVVALTRKGRPAIRMSFGRPRPIKIRDVELYTGRERSFIIITVADVFERQRNVRRGHCAQSNGDAKTAAVISRHGGRGPRIRRQRCTQRIETGSTLNCGGKLSPKWAARRVSRLGEGGGGEGFIFSL